ncbi:tyrosine-type recombinase/integrase [Streptomyces sp. WM6372]|uniref:tyrosine-type recombinase/integrase n=1 Tax=Streptomyces sp. WM6372 TaxID=1415555 RepID=UPI0022772B54|nr:tyrosine-type recombinase/integrase [Streptomyces sp. WM6372]
MPRTRGDPDDPFAGLVCCRPDGRPLGPHQVLDRLRRLSAEAGVPGVTVHDLRHLAATITITAGVPLTVVSKTLRRSTLSTTANLYSHLAQQAAREAVDTIDRTLTGPEETGRRTDRPAWWRPHGDHHGPGRTKGRPPMVERTASDLRFRMVGTTGFEPATP